MNGTGNGNIHAATTSEKLQVIILVSLGIALQQLIAGGLWLTYSGKTIPEWVGITLGAVVGIFGAAVTTRPDPNKSKGQQPAVGGGNETVVVEGEGK